MASLAASTAAMVPIMYILRAVASTFLKENVACQLSAWPIISTNRTSPGRIYWAYKAQAVSVVVAEVAVSAVAVAHGEVVALAVAVAATQPVIFWLVARTVSTAQPHLV